jgi:hypothetical protein
MNFQNKIQICHLFYPSFSLQSPYLSIQPFFLKNMQLDANLSLKRLYRAK